MAVGIILLFVGTNVVVAGNSVQEKGINTIYNKGALILKLKTNDAHFFGFDFVTIYGIIEYNGEIIDDMVGVCYNITPIRVSYFQIGYIPHEGLIFEHEKFTHDTPYIHIPKDYFYWHGSVGEHFMFLWSFIFELLWCYCRVS